MIIEFDENTNNEDLKHRRKGGAYDDLARILRKINKAQFGTGSIIEDRPGVLTPNQVVDVDSFVKSKSVFEFYQQKEAENDYYNLIYIGRKGTGNKRYTNYIELSANSKSNEQSIGNGYVGLTLAKDGEDYSKAKIALYQGGNYPDILGGLGARAEITGEGLGGGVQLSYYYEDGTVIAFVLDKDGFQIYGLPTSAPSGSNKLWNSAGTLKIT